MAGSCVCNNKEHCLTPCAPSVQKHDSSGEERCLSDDYEDTTVDEGVCVRGRAYLLWIY